VLIIHGYQGAPHSGWKPWLQKELRGRGFDVFVPAMPSPNSPRQKKWVETISNLADKPTRNDFLVGHSLGCIAILRYLEKLAPGEHVGGVILVAGFTDDLGMEDLSSFFRTPIEWSEIRSHCAKFVAVHSDNDRYVPLAHGKSFELNLGAELVVQHNMGHFSGSEGCTQLPVVLDKLLEMAK
jgi:predicted alpha/beta hydrolase family esterase